ncbi:MAG: DUF1987 domain-containing protein [Desulfobacterales bacterium]|nr:DUF1987 domain-containing protein [Desulfobacterales bacterium]
MQDLIIPATESTPEIQFNYLEKRFEIRGESFPDNVGYFYEPIFNWIREYLDNHDEFVLHMELIYFNSSSSKVLLDLFDLLETYAQNGKQIYIHWVYDKENYGIKEYGIEFKEDLEFLKFDFFEI